MEGDNLCMTSDGHIEYEDDDEEEMCNTDNQDLSDQNKETDHSYSSEKSDPDPMGWYSLGVA